jgi:hypothetical protein
LINMQRNKIQLVLVATLTTVLLLGATTSAHASLYDLTTDWSDSLNPNGVWSYNQGSTPLPHQTSWVGFGTAQPAWARSTGNADTTYLPAWFKVTAANSGVIDLLTGDVGLHTTDTANGVGSGPGNVTWTSPVTGTVNLSGSVWQTRNIGRSNHWSLFINNSVITAGDISGSNSSRNSPFSLAGGTSGSSVLQNISVSTGDVIRLQFDQNSGNNLGDFVGVRFTVETTITSTTAPEPGTLAFLALGGTLVVVRRRRQQG